MALTHIKNQWYREVPLPQTVAYAEETPSGRLFAIHTDGRVMLDDVELSDPESQALNNFGPEKLGYPIPHSGEGPCVVESNGYVTAACMGSFPLQKQGTPIWVYIYHPDKGVVRYVIEFAGMVRDGNPKYWPGIDNHPRPQLFVRASDKRVVYLGSGHNKPINASVSHLPHAGYNFPLLHPVGPVSTHPTNGHTYPAAVLIGDTLHVVSRFLSSAQYQLAYWTLDTLTMQTGPHQILDIAPKDHTYAIWYQQLSIDGGTLVIDTKRRYRLKGEPDTVLSDPEPKTYEIAI